MSDGITTMLEGRVAGLKDRAEREQRREATGYIDNI